MILLVFDVDLMPGGVRRVQENLVPRLCPHFEKVIWYLPQYRLPDIQAMNEKHKCQIKFEPHGFSTIAHRLLVGAKRRIPWMFSQKHPQAFQFSQPDIQRLIDTHRVTHTLCTFARDTPIPQLSLPINAWIHDLNKVPECIYSWARNANVVFTPTSFVADTLRPFISISKTRIVTSPLVADLNATKANENDKHEITNTATKRIFLPAGMFPHKNHSVLVEAAILASSVQSIQIDLSGFHQNQVPTTLHQKIVSAESAGVVVNCHGYVDNEFVENLYRSCDFVALPTSYEGFGLPLIEAVSRHRYVLASDIDVFHEIVDFYDIGKAVRFIQSGNVNEWTKALAEPFPKFEAKFPYTTEEIEERFTKWLWDDLALLVAKEIKKLGKHGRV